MINMTEGKTYGTVLIKAKLVLDYMLAQDEGQTLKEISDGIKLPKSTALKILNTLCEQNLIWRTDDTKKYYFGTELIGYGERAVADFNINRIALPYLKYLRDETKETVNLGIEQNNKVVFLQRLESPQSINVKSRIGSKLNLYSTAMGKAILSTKTSDELDEYFSEVILEPLTPYTMTRISKIYEQIQEIKTNGYAIDNRENQNEVICFGASLEKAGKVHGAFSVSMPAFRIDKLKKKRMIKYVKETKRQIEFWL